MFDSIFSNSYIFMFDSIVSNINWNFNWCLSKGDWLSRCFNVLGLISEIFANLPYVNQYIKVNS